MAYLAWTAVLRLTAAIGLGLDTYGSNPAVRELVFDQPSDAIVRFLAAPFLSAFAMAAYVGTRPRQRFAVLLIGAALAPLSFLVASIVASLGSHAHPAAYALERTMGRQVHFVAVILGATAIPFWLLATALTKRSSSRSSEARS
jgi:hypothetical protein